MVLVDSTVWIDLLRKRTTACVARLRKLLEFGEDPARGTRHCAGGPARCSKFRCFPGVAPLFHGPPPVLGADRTVELHLAAAQLYARARWQAVTPRSPHDCLVAATALFSDVPLLHDDKDFERLAAIEPRLKLVPRG